MAIWQTFVIIAFNQIRGTLETFNLMVSKVSQTHLINKYQ